MLDPIKAGMHTGAVWSMLITSDHQLITGSRDSTVRVWDIYSRKCLHLITDHAGFVQCMTTHGNMLYTGGMDGVVFGYKMSNKFEKMYGMF